MNICFDLDGPIIDVSERYYRAYIESLKGFDVDSNQILTKEYFWTLKRNRITDIEIGVLSGLTIRESKQSSTKRRLLSFKSEYMILDKVYDDVFNTLEKLRKLRINYFLITLRTKSQLNFAIKHLKLNKYFAESLLFCLDESEEFQGDIHHKYSSFFQAVTQLSLDPKDTWAIGDSENEYHAGKLARYGKIILITRGMRSREQLQVLKPDLIIDNLNQLLDLV